MLKQGPKKLSFYNVGTLPANGHKTRTNGELALVSPFDQDVSDLTRTDVATKPEPDTLTDPLAALIAVSQNLVSLEAEPLLALILNQLRAVAGYSGAVVARVEDNKLRPVAGLESIGEADLAESPLCQRVVEERVPVIIADIQEEEAPQPFQPWGVGATNKDRAWFGIPLLFNDAVIGLLILFHQEPGYFSAEKVKRVLSFTGYVTMAVAQKQLCQQACNLAALEERHRLAQELHDNVAQVLGYLNLQLSMTSTLLASGQTAETEANLRELKQIVNETYTDVREEIFNLRAKAFSGLGFLEMLHKYTAKYRRYYDLNIRLVLEVPESALEFPADVGRQMIRVIQEALINVRKHAQVSQAQICLRQEAGRIGVSVEDEGQGFDLSQPAMQPDNSSFGLEIMGERAATIGGELVIESYPGKGTTITLWVPLPRTD